MNSSGQQSLSYPCIKFSIFVSAQKLDCLSDIESNTNCTLVFRSGTILPCKKDVRIVNDGRSLLYLYYVDILETAPILLAEFTASGSGTLLLQALDKYLEVSMSEGCEDQGTQVAGNTLLFRLDI